MALARGQSIAIIYWDVASALAKAIINFAMPMAETTEDGYVEHEVNQIPTQAHELAGWHDAHLHMMRSMSALNRNTWAGADMPGMPT